MNSKKLMSGALAAAMSCSMVAFADTTATTVPVNALQSDLANASDNLKHAAMELTGFGIMEGNGDQFGPADLLTRAQAAKIFVNATGNGRLNGSVNRFADVNASDWFSPYANIADQTGIMIGSNKKGKRYFGPNDNLTFAQVATIAVRALGYKPADLDGDTWPYNYMAKAMELGIFDNVENDIDADQKVTRGDMALIVDKTLNTEVKPLSTTATPKTLLSKSVTRFVKTVDGKKVAVAISLVKGTVTGTAASNPTLKANEIMIGDVKYNVPATDLLAKLALTSSVEVYTDTKSNSIVSVEKVTVVSTLDRKDIVTDKAADTTGLTAWNVFYKDTSVTPAVVNKALDINPSATVYFNGQKAANAKEAVGKIGVGAKVTLIENTKPVDGSADLKPGYDTVIVNYTEKYLVTADAATDATDFAQRSIKKADTTLGTVTFSGAAAKFTEIKKNDVVYVTATVDNAVVNIEVLRKTVSGSVTAIAADGKVTVGGVQYAVSLPVGTPPLTISNAAETLYILDKDNTVVNYTLPATAVTPTVGGVTYGYVSAATPDNSWGTYTFKAKVVKTDGTEVILTIGTGTSATVADKGVTDAAVAGMKNHLVYYTTNATTGISTITAVPQAIIADGFTAKRVVADTVVYKYDSVAQTITKINPATIVMPADNATNVYFAAKNPAYSTMGDYYAVVVVDPTAATVSSDKYGYVTSYVGQELFTRKDGTTVVAEVYNSFENGVAKTLKFVGGNTAISIAANTAFSALTVDGDGLITANANGNIVTGKTVTAIDADRVYVNGNIYQIDKTNVKVYNKKDANYKLDAMSNVAANDTIDYVVDVNGKVVLIVINK